MERDRIPETVLTTGKIFEKAMRGLADLELVGEVRGSHFMIGIEFVRDRATKTSFPDEVGIGLRVSRAAQKRGLIARPLGNSLILSPPLIFTPEIIARTEAILRESIEAVTREI